MSLGKRPPRPSGFRGKPRDKIVHPKVGRKTGNKLRKLMDTAR